MPNQAYMWRNELPVLKYLLCLKVCINSCRFFFLIFSPHRSQLILLKLELLSSRSCSRCLDLSCDSLCVYCVFFLLLQWCLIMKRTPLFYLYIHPWRIILVSQLRFSALQMSSVTRETHLDDYSKDFCDNVHVIRCLILRQFCDKIYTFSWLL